MYIIVYIIDISILESKYLCMGDLFQNLSVFISGVDPLWQWLATILVGMIPFVESYFGSTISILAGVSPFIAIPAAIIGNFFAVWVMVETSAKVRRNVVAGEEEISNKKLRIKRAFEKYGVPGVSLIGQSILPSQITAPTLVGLGADKKQVLFWQFIAISLYGVVFGLLAVYGLGYIAN